MQWLLIFVIFIVALRSENFIPEHLEVKKYRFNIEDDFEVQYTEVLNDKKEEI